MEFSKINLLPDLENISPENTEKKGIVMEKKYPASAQLKRKVLGERNEIAAMSDGNTVISPFSLMISQQRNDKSHRYDPLTNYTCPRPEFLRYNPDRRREILRRIDLERKWEEDESDDSSVSSEENESDDSDADEFEEIEGALPVLGASWNLLILLAFLVSVYWFMSSDSSSSIISSEQKRTSQGNDLRINDQILFELSSMCSNMCPGEVHPGIEVNINFINKNPQNFLADELNTKIIRSDEEEVSEVLETSQSSQNSSQRVASQAAELICHLEKTMHEKQQCYQSDEENEAIDLHHPEHNSNFLLNNRSSEEFAWPLVCNLHRDLFEQVHLVLFILILITVILGVFYNLLKRVYEKSKAPSSPLSCSISPIEPVVEQKASLLNSELANMQNNMDQLELFSVPLRDIDKSPLDSMNYDIENKENKMNYSDTCSMPQDLYKDRRDDESFKRRQPVLELLGELSIADAIVNRNNALGKINEGGDFQLLQYQRKHKKDRISASANEIHRSSMDFSVLKESIPNGYLSAQQKIAKKKEHDSGKWGKNTMKDVTTPLRRSTRLRNQITSP